MLELICVIVKYLYVYLIEHHFHFSPAIEHLSICELFIIIFNTPLSQCLLFSKC